MALKPGNRVRIDIPDELDPGFESHGEHAIVLDNDPGRCTSGVGMVLSILLTKGGAIKSVKTNASTKSWDLELLGPEHDTLSEIYDFCEENGLSLTVDAVVDRLESIEDRLDVPVSELLIPTRRFELVDLQRILKQELREIDCWGCRNDRSVIIQESARFQNWEAATVIDMSVREEDCINVLGPSPRRSGNCSPLP